MPRLSACFLICLLFAAAPAAAEQVLRVAVPAIPAVLDPQRALTAIERAVAAEVFEGLVSLDDAGRPAPGLAESWTVNGTHYVFTLRPGLKWSDGRPLTADDIVGSLKRALDPATGAPLAAELLTIKNAEAFQLGTLTQNQGLGVAARDGKIEIDLAAPSQRFLQVLATPLAAAVPRHRIAVAGATWSSSPNVVASGPFMPAAAGDRYVLTRNPNYGGSPKPALDRIAFVIAPSADAAQDLVANDDADLTLGFAPQPRIGRGNRVLRSERGDTVYRWVVNVAHKPFDRREVRHALAMAFDRSESIADLKIAEAQPAYSLVPPDLVDGYRPPLASYAKLKQAERDVIAEVLLLDLDRKTPRPVRLAIPAGQVHAVLADRAARIWRRLGFATDVVVRDAAAHEAALIAGDFDVAVFAGRDRDADPWPFLFPLSRAAGPLNVARYAETDFDERLLPADNRRDAQDRLDDLHWAEVALTEDQVIWPLLFFRPAAAVARPVTGWTGNFSDTHPLKYLSIQ